MNQTITRFLQKNLYTTNSKRWIDVHKHFVYSCNISFHSATNKVPFKLFYNRSGFNNADSIETLNNEMLLSSENVYLNGQSDSSIDLNYLERMNRNANIKNQQVFEKDDMVLVKMDFDNNIKTKKNKLISFYENPGIVVERLTEDLYMVNIDGKNCCIHSNHIKKINI